MSGTRQQIMATLVEWMADAQRDGRDGIKTAEAAFPGVPIGVLAEAWSEAEFNSQEAWWRSVERTIDAEVIRNAITASKGDRA